MKEIIPYKKHELDFDHDFDLFDFEITNKKGYRSTYKKKENSKVIAEMADVDVMGIKVKCRSITNKKTGEVKTDWG
jgi:hypothetical protein